MAEACPIPAARLFVVALYRPLFFFLNLVALSNPPLSLFDDRIDIFNADICCRPLLVAWNFSRVAPGSSKLEH